MATPFHPVSFTVKPLMPQSRPPSPYVSFTAPSSFKVDLSTINVPSPRIGSERKTQIVTIPEIVSREFPVVVPTEPVLAPGNNALASMKTIIPLDDIQRVTLPQTDTALSEIIGDMPTSNTRTLITPTNPRHVAISALRAINITTLALSMRKSSGRRGGRGGRGRGRGGVRSTRKREDTYSIVQVKEIAKNIGISNIAVNKGALIGGIIAAMHSAGVLAEKIQTLKDAGIPIPDIYLKYSKG